MAVDSWKVALNGDWNNDLFWTGGVPTASSDVHIDLLGKYTVALTQPAIATSMTMDALDATLDEKAGSSLVMSGKITLLDGTINLRGSNAIAGIDVYGGALQADHSEALGGAALDLYGGEFVGLKSMTVANAIAFHDDFTVAASHNTTLDWGSGGWSTNGGIIVIGDKKHDGTVFWNGPQSGAGAYSIDVRAGTLLGGNNFLGQLFFGPSVTVEAGATIDLAGSSVILFGLNGSGTVKSDTAAPVSLELTSFAGSLSGALEITLGGDVTLTGNSNPFSVVVPNHMTLTLGHGGTSGSLGQSILEVDNGGTLVLNRSDTFSLENNFFGAGDLQLSGSGTVVVNESNNHTGEIDILAGTAALGDPLGLGSGLYQMEGGAILATATETITNQFIITDDCTLAAKHGRALTLAPSHFFIKDIPLITLDFGRTGDDGTVIWNATGTFSADSDNRFNVHVAAGTLRDGDGSLTDMTSIARAVIVDAGATLDCGSFADVVRSLGGAGTVKAGTLFVDGGSFAGTIVGATNLTVIDNFVLTGTNTYKGGTQINAGTILALGNGGATGSIVGNIVDNGSLFADRSGTLTLAGKISGTGHLDQIGHGTTVLSHKNTYTGGTLALDGTLSLATAGAAGQGPLSLQGGELLATKTMAFANPLSMSGTFTIAAAHGITLTVNKTVGFLLAEDGGGTMNFGSASADGIVVWNTPSGSVIQNAIGYDIAVHGGTLRAGTGTFDTLTSNANSIAVDAGATIDVHGQGVLFEHLHGAGTVLNSGAAAELDLEDANFAGVINGPLTVDVFNTVVLSGGGTFGEADLTGASTLHLENAAHENVRFVNVDAMLILDDPNVFDGSVFGFGSTNVIDLTGVDWGGGTTRSYNRTSHVLTVTDGTHTAHVTFNGNYRLANFVIGSDDSGGTLISFDAAHRPAVHDIASDWMFG